MSHIKQFILALTFCIASSALLASQPIADILHEPEIKPGSNIAIPAGDVVLTLNGNITTKNQGDELNLDLQTLEKFGISEYAVDDPWEEKRVMYSGILLADLLEYSGYLKPIEQLIVTASDGYASVIPMHEIDQWPVLLATRKEGELMSSDEKGPTRIIFPYQYVEDVQLARNMSVWGIKSIEVQ